MEVYPFSMVCSPFFFDFDFNRKVELVLGGGIGFVCILDEIKKVWVILLVYHTMKIKPTLQLNLKGGLNYSLDSKSFIQGDYGFNFVNSSIDNYTSDFTAHSFNAKFVINF